jgi:hypothetical protein
MGSKKALAKQVTASRNKATKLQRQAEQGDDWYAVCLELEERAIASDEAVRTLELTMETLQEEMANCTCKVYSCSLLNSRL